MASRLTVGLFLVLVLVLVGCFAAETHQVWAEEDTTRPINVVIVLDDSGSMAECTEPWNPNASVTQCTGNQKPPSDLNALRYSAARLLIHLADSKDRIGVLRFDDAVDTVLALQEVGDARNRDVLSDKVQPPASYRSRSYTRIDLGLSQAAKMLLSSLDRPSYVLFLTDGNPTGPNNVNQADSVTKTMRDLRARGVQVFSIALCNRDCPDAFLKAHMAQDQPVREARTASDLLRVFSQVFAEMKPTLHVVGGDLQFSIKDYHAVSDLFFVTEHETLKGVTRSSRDVPVQTAFKDNNIVLNTVEYAVIGQGDWKVDTTGGGFVVARTKTYPDLIYPPPAVAGSAAAPHYFPAGRPVLLAAQAVGPIGDAQLLLDGNTALKPMSMDGALRWVQLPADSAAVRLQIGADKKPLIIDRTFRLVPVQGAPEARASAPACAANTACELRVALQPGPAVDGLTAAVFVIDKSDGDRTVHENRNLTCNERECVDATFRPQDGHVYQIRYLISAINAQGQRYGDWVETTLPMRPAIYIRGLPEVLNLKQQPPDGWPVTVVVGTTEDLGKLHARVALTPVGEKDARPVEGLAVEFGADISGRQPEVQTTLRITGYEMLSPGNYKGELEFYLDKPPAATVNILMPAAYSVVYNLAKAEATVLTKDADFGEVAYEPSENFRIDQTATMEVRFNDVPFSLKVDGFGSPDCPDMRLMVVHQDDRTDLTATLTLRLQSTGRVSAKDCSGQFNLVPSDRPEDRTVNNGEGILWQLRVQGIEWAILGSIVDGKEVSSVTFNDLTTPADAPGAEVTLIVRYSGKPPFKLELADSTLMDPRRQEGLGAADFTPVVMDIQPDPVRAQIYRVNLQLVPTRNLPSHWWFTRSFSGQLAFRIAGLPEMNAQPIDTFVNSTGWRDRRLIPFVMKWIVRLWPFWVFFILILYVLRRRSRIGRVLHEDNPVQQSPSSPNNPESLWSDEPPSWERDSDRWTIGQREVSGGSFSVGASGWQSGGTDWGSGWSPSSEGMSRNSRVTSGWSSADWISERAAESVGTEDFPTGGEGSWASYTSGTSSVENRANSGWSGDWASGDSQVRMSSGSAVKSWDTFGGFDGRESGPGVW